MKSKFTVALRKFLRDRRMMSNAGWRADKCDGGYFIVGGGVPFYFVSAETGDIYKIHAGWRRAKEPCASIYRTPWNDHYE